MSHKTSNVLVVGDDPGQVLLLEEAFTEMGDLHLAGRDLPFCHRQFVRGVAQAVEALDKERFDLILLDLAASPSAGLLAFLRLRTHAPDIPVVALAPREDEAMALSLVRQGAQDYLLYGDIDCLPLAHQIRCALERNRLWLAQQSISLVDELTGLYNRRGFLQAVERDARLAHMLHLGLTGWLVDTQAEEYDRQHHDLVVIEAAEWLRGAARDTDAIGLWDARRLAVVRIGNDQTGLAAPEDGRLLIGSGSLPPGHELELEHLLETAEAALCQNRLVESRAGRYL